LSGARTHESTILEQYIFSAEIEKHFRWFLVQMKTIEFAIKINCTKGLTDLTKTDGACAPLKCACGYQNLVGTSVYGGHNLSWYSEQSDYVVMGLANPLHC
jgi:hypothetical protein